MRVFSYKITRDYGFAPNPFYGVCTLATCAPKIRTVAVPGDIVVGCGISENKLAGHAIFIMRVSGKCSFQEYWNNNQFAVKRPFFGSSLKRAYGDNIYHHDVGDLWIQERSHHTFSDGTLNESNLARDTSSDNVLWGVDFAYFGAQAPLIPNDLRSYNGDDLYPNCRSHRSKFPEGMEQAVDHWFTNLSVRGCQGRPGAWR